MDDDLPSLEELLRKATEIQASQQTEIHLTARSDENLGHLEWTDVDEIGSPERELDSCKGESAGFLSL